MERWQQTDRHSVFGRKGDPFFRDGFLKPFACLQ
jgi:hypothetical protein